MKEQIIEYIKQCLKLLAAGLLPEEAVKGIGWLIAAYVSAKLTLAVGKALHELGRWSWNTWIKPVFGKTAARREVEKQTVAEKGVALKRARIVAPAVTSARAYSELPSASYQLLLKLESRGSSSSDE